MRLPNLVADQLADWCDNFNSIKWSIHFAICLSQKEKAHSWLVHAR